MTTISLSFPSTMPKNAVDELLKILNPVLRMAHVVTVVDETESPEVHTIKDRHGDTRTKRPLWSFFPSYAQAIAESNLPSSPCPPNPSMRELNADQSVVSSGPVNLPFYNGTVTKQLIKDAEKLLNKRSNHDVILEQPRESYQQQVQRWLIACFGEKITNDPVERNYRFLEESLELVQACNFTREEAHYLVDYVFDRSAGDKRQEVGGVMNTLAALCSAHDLDLDQCTDAEMARVWTMIDTIRSKQTRKPRYEAKM